jgi:hypothetical protein
VYEQHFGGKVAVDPDTLLWIEQLVDDSGTLAFACGCGRLR